MKEQNSSGLSKVVKIVGVGTDFEKTITVPVAYPTNGNKAITVFCIGVDASPSTDVDIKDFSKSLSG
jgi:hypothetical protein